MMFSKDNSNTGGEPLCRSCKWCTNYMQKGLTHMGVCLLDEHTHADVGICRDYEGVTNG